MNPWQTMLASGLGAEPELNLPKPKKAPMDPRMLASFVEQGNTAAAPPEPESVLPDPNNFIPPQPVMKSTVAEQDQLFKELLDLQRGQSSRLMTAADDFENQEQQFDLSPLMALADSWTGSKLASAYKAPMSRDERALTAMKLRDAAGDATGKAADLALKRLSSGEMSESKILARALASDKAESKRDEFLARENRQWAKQLNDDWKIKALETQEMGLDAVSGLLEMAQEGNTLAFSSAGPKMAKALGEVGVLTERDVTRYTTSAEVARKLSDTWKKWMQGTPSEATMEEIQAIVKGLNAKMPEKIYPRYKKYVNQFAEATGIPHAEAARRLNVNWNLISGAKAKAADSGLVRPEDVPEADWKRMPRDLQEKLSKRGKK